jgi:hypothetical protein
MDELNKNMDKFNFTFDIDSIIKFVIINYKQLLLLCVAFIIVYIVDLITFHNSLIYGVTSNLPGKNLPVKNLLGKNLKIKNKKQKNKK